MSSNNNLGMVEAKLPPGFRFHPRDVELICDYLMKKIGRWEQVPPLLIEVDLNKSEPWDIPEMACVGGREWYFYSQRDRKYATGCRTNRATVSGYWKATGKDRPIVRSTDNRLVGMRKTLVFYKGRAPKGKKTDWVMHEFRLEGPLALPQNSSLKEDWVLCRVFYKSREVEEVASAKQGIGSSSSCDETRSSSSLPALMDSYITFNQSQTSNNNNNNEQVPCFSIFSTPNQTISGSGSGSGSGSSTTTSTSASVSATTTTSSKNMDLQYPPLIISSTTSTTPPTMPMPMPMPMLSVPYLNVLNSFDKEAAAVINHLNKMHTNIPSNTKESSSSFGQGITSECLLSESLWSHY